MVAKEKKITFALPTTNGTMAEWLGSGLQNRVQQFDSAWYLTKIRSKVSFGPDFLLLPYKENIKKTPCVGGFFIG